MSFDAVLKRYFPVVLLALVAIAAYFQASGITQIIGSALAVDDKALLASGPFPARAGPAASHAYVHTTSAKRIIERNPFDSVTGNLNPPIDSASAATAGPPVPSTDDPYNAPECDGTKVLATAVSDDAAWSFASLVGGTGEGTTSHLRRQGDDYAGKRVWFIRWDRVWLIGPGSFCQIEMFPRNSDKAAASARAAAAAASSAKSAAPTPAGNGGDGAPSVPDDIKSKIQKVSANEYNVDRSVIDKILENQAVLMRSARIVPEQEGGKTVGIRLFGIRPDTMLGVIGLENGDRLEKINGFDMASPEKALEAYARLRAADHLTVTVNRRGATQNIDFNIKLSKARGITNMNDDQSILRKTVTWTAALLGASILWVSLLSGASLLVVWKALPDSSATGATNPATPTPKPASSEPPSRTSPAHDDAPTKRRNG